MTAALERLWDVAIVVPVEKRHAPEPARYMPASIWAGRPREFASDGKRGNRVQRWSDAPRDWAVEYVRRDTVPWLDVEVPTDKIAGHLQPAPVMTRASAARFLLDEMRRTDRPALPRHIRDELAAIAGGDYD